MKRQTTALVAAALILLGPRALVAQTTTKAEKPKTRFELFPYPSLRVKDAFRIDFHLKLQEDHRNFPDATEPEDPWTLSRKRLGIEGTLVKIFDYEVEREFSGDGRWTDVFLNYRQFDAMEVRAGKFKEPFSLEQTTSDFNLQFILRPVIARDLAPGRSRGVMAHGRLAKRFVSYEAGVFQHDGENSRFSDNPGGDTTVAGRVRFEPWRSDKTSLFRNLEFGVSANECNVPEGLNSLRARAIDGTFIFERAYVQGRRVRLGTELSWLPGVFGVKSEFVQVWEDRKGQGIFGDDLPRLGTSGWYVSGSWLLTGDKKANVPPPRRPLFEGGIGAIEAAVRYEDLWSGSNAAGEPEEDNPRAPNLVESSYHAWTLGVSWYINRWGKVQFNAVRESFDPPGRSPVPATPAYWSGLWRFQFVL